MRAINRASAILLLLATAACADRTSPTTPPNPPSEPPKDPPKVVGLYTLQVTGIATDQATSSLKAAAAPETGNGVRGVLTNAGAGLVFEQVATTTFNEGGRTNGGQRYVSFTYRVKNGTGAPLNNVTLLLVARSNTISGTSISTLKKLDGTNANTSIAYNVLPTGAVALGSDFVSVQALYPDVLQVLTEAEAAAITKPADVSDIFPVGYMIRSKNSTANRNLPVPSDPNQYDGLLTASFRLPLQSSASQDVNSIFFEILAVTDTETKLTESIEESQDTAAVRRLRDRATALGATTVTVLNGSPATDPAVPDYPGQRQICSPRTSGTAATPLNTIVSVGAYSRLAFYRSGEARDVCAAYFRNGTAALPALSDTFSVGVYMMDRYGNLRTGLADTVHLAETNGVPATMVEPSVPINPASAGAILHLVYNDYGTSVLAAVGRRLVGYQIIPVAGVRRTWTAGAGTTDYSTPKNWLPLGVPASLDSIWVPASPAGGPIFPALTANVQNGGVRVDDVATLSLNAFDMTTSGNVKAGLTGGITNTSGRLFLAGIARTVEGKVPTIRVTGTYSATTGSNINVTARAPIQVDAGRLTISGVRLQADSN